MVIYLEKVKNFERLDLMNYDVFSTYFFIYDKIYDKLKIKCRYSNSNVNTFKSNFFPVIFFIILGSCFHNFFAFHHPFIPCWVHLFPVDSFNFLWDIFKIFMLEGLLSGDSFLWIELKHFLNIKHKLLVKDRYHAS